MAVAKTKRAMVCVHMVHAQPSAAWTIRNAIAAPSICPAWLPVGPPWWIPETRPRNTQVQKYHSWKPVWIQKRSSQLWNPTGSGGNRKGLLNRFGPHCCFSRLSGSATIANYFRNQSFGHTSKSTCVLHATDLKLIHLLWNSFLLANRGTSGRTTFTCFSRP